MTGLKQTAIGAVTIAVAVMLGACSNTATNLLSTGSITGSQPQQAAATPKVATPVDRALQVAATSARAQKCGYFFDPAQLRAAYLQAETARGTPVAQMANVTNSYDFTAVKVAKAIAGNQAYCSPARTKTIKTSLSRYLSGDFEAVIKPTEKESMFGWLESDAPEGREVLDPEAVFDPRARKKTKTVEE
ncbi:MAG: hypothetical protein AAFQ45_15620 [Pseudomonadota bacterium]